MPKRIETRNIAGRASDVFLQLQTLLLDGWLIWKQTGFCRPGCETVDTLNVYLMREIHPEPYREPCIDDLGRPI